MAASKLRRPLFDTEIAQVPSPVPWTRSSQPFVYAKLIAGNETAKSRAFLAFGFTSNSILEKGGVGGVILMLIGGAAHRLGPIE